MRAYDEGLTAVYNRFHEKSDLSSGIQKLRQLHVALDKSVAKLYGWDSCLFGHDFYETKQGIRFTISEASRFEIVKSLLELNRQRYQEEVNNGLHDKTIAKRTSDGSRKPRQPRAAYLPFGTADAGEED